MFRTVSVRSPAFTIFMRTNATHRLLRGWLSIGERAAIYGQLYRSLTPRQRARYHRLAAMGKARRNAAERRRLKKLQNQRNESFNTFVQRRWNTTRGGPEVRLRKLSIEWITMRKKQGK